MDLKKKISTLINAATRSKLSSRGRRHDILREQEEKLLKEVQEALAAVEAQEKVLFERYKREKVLAQKAEEEGNFSLRREHERRAMEIDRELEQESLQALDLEEKLTALKEKLDLAQSAVEKEAQSVLQREEEADKVIEQDESSPEKEPSLIRKRDLERRKSRLAGD